MINVCIFDFKIENFLNFCVLNNFFVANPFVFLTKRIENKNICKQIYFIYFFNKTYWKLKPLEKTSNVTFRCPHFSNSYLIGS